ncbi:MAG: 7-carboxy-7-deazaguanine synthase QueE [Rickettsiaceae bacterium]|nr:7-carboxy-7-deazaguanine synthase QueE [Rickettsiaceae bacterium]
MFGNNPKRKPEIGNGDFLYITKIFKTIQGEGPYVGMGGIFIRLGGCNLACHFCDTEFENFTKMNISTIIDEVNNLAKDSIKLVVITGGEPLRQPIALLCKKLLDARFKVQMETNGTLYRELPKQVEIVCSPKIIANKYLKIRQELIPHIKAIKFLISANIPGYNQIADNILQDIDKQIPIYVQPIDEFDEQKTKFNEQLAVDLAINKGYILSYQIHKKLGIE